MKKLLFIAEFLFLCMSLSHAQVNFFHRANFDTLKYSWGKEVKYCEGKFYVFGGFIRETTVGSYKVYLTTHDLEGNQLLLQKADTLGDSVSYYPALPNAMYLASNGKIYATGNKAYAPYMAAGSIYLFDTTGSFNYVVNKQDSSIYYEGITKQSDFIYVVGEIVDSLGDRSNLLIAKYDTALNQIWERTFITPESDLCRGVFSTSDSGVVFAASTGPVWAWVGHIMKVDKNGSLVFDRYDPVSLGLGELHLMDYNNEKSYYLFNKFYYTNNNQTQIMEVLQTDTGLHLQWKKSWIIYDTFGPTDRYGLWNNVRVSDGHVFCGNKNSAGEGWVFKINDTGDMIWEATYTNLHGVAWPSFGHTFYISGIDTIPNGGFVLSGSTVDSINRQVAFIMSIDSNGCFSNDTCEAIFYSGITYYSSAVSVKVFPNPVNEILQVQITNAQLNTASILVADLLGRRVVAQKLEGELITIPTNLWSSGLYFWTIIENERIVKSGKVLKE